MQLRAKAKDRQKNQAVFPEQTRGLSNDRPATFVILKQLLEKNDMRNTMEEYLKHTMEERNQPEPKSTRRSLHTSIQTASILASLLSPRATFRLTENSERDHKLGTSDVTVIISETIWYTCYWCAKASVL